MDTRRSRRRAGGSRFAPDPAGKRRVDTVTICHVPPGQLDQERTRQVDQAAVAALLANTASYPGACVVYGDAVPMGDGTLTTYAQRDGPRPSANGVVFPRVELSGLPTSPSDGHHCYDVDGDGTIDPHDECVGGHESVLLLPGEFRGADDSPFQLILFNWNPEGHPPPAVYTLPHFDFHFFTMDLEDRNAIDEGPCALLVDCSDFQRATVSVPGQFLPQDYQDLGAVEAAMATTSST